MKDSKKSRAIQKKFKAGQVFNQSDSMYYYTYRSIKAI